MADRDLKDKDLLRIVASVIFGSSVMGFLKSSGIFDSLVGSVGSTAAAYLALMVLTGIILIRWW